MLLGAFLMGLAWLKLGTSEPETRWIGSAPDNPPQTPKVNQSIPLPPAAVAAKSGEQTDKPGQPANNTGHTPKFDFYHKLPKHEVSVTAKPLELRQNKKAQPQNKVYYLQIASFTKHQEAEALRAELGFSGLETAINSVKFNGTKHYRVITGPFVNTVDLHLTQQQLQQQGYPRPLVITKDK